MESPQQEYPSPQQAQVKFDEKAINAIINADSIIEEVRQFLVGKILLTDANGNLNELKIGQQQMNDKGILSVISSMRIHIGKNVALSQLTAEEINQMCIDNSEALAFDLYRNYLEYEVNFWDIERIVINIDDIVFSSLKRALNAGTLKAIATALEIKEINSEKQPNILKKIGSVLRGR